MQQMDRSSKDVLLFDCNVALFPKRAIYARSIGRWSAVKDGRVGKGRGANFTLFPLIPPTHSSILGANFALTPFGAI